MLGVREDDEGGRGCCFFFVVQFATRSLFDVFLARDMFRTLAVADSDFLHLEASVKRPCKAMAIAPQNEFT